jgi:hypothetical protein
MVRNRDLAPGQNGSGSDDRPSDTRFSLRQTVPHLADGARNRGSRP